MADKKQNMGGPPLRAYPGFKQELNLGPATTDNNTNSIHPKTDDRQQNKNQNNNQSTTSTQSPCSFFPKTN